MNKIKASNERSKVRRRELMLKNPGNYNLEMGGMK